MKINSVKEYVKILNRWKRNGTDGKINLQDISLVYAWNYVPEQVVLDVIAHYDYADVSNSLTPSDVNEWKNRVLFKN